MGNLPPEDEQAWLLDELGRLVELCGEDRFVNGPIVLPTNEAFPDVWTPDLQGVERVTQRILQHVGLEGYRLRLQRFDQEQVVDHVGTDGSAQFRHEGAAAWFAGVDGDTIWFGCAEEQIQEAGEQLIGIMAHEVAHAWRTLHGVRVDDRDTEECLTDLTTVYFGFGIFTVNNTFRFRTFREERGALLYSGYRYSKSGYLSPQAMSFLFAAQLSLRGLGWWKRRGLLGWLEANQRGHVKAALRALGPAASVRTKLGLTGV